MPDATPQNDAYVNQPDDVEHARITLALLREMFPSLCPSNAYCRHEPSCHQARRTIDILERWADAR